MRLIPPSPKAVELEADAERLRNGFEDLAARISAKVRHDRDVAEHLRELELQAAEIEAARSCPEPPPGGQA